MSAESHDVHPRADARRNRRQVLDAAVALLAQRPQATMQEIADACGLGRTTVYRHFPKRQDLIDALFEEVQREAAETIEEALREPESVGALLRDIGERIIRIGDRYAFLDAHPELRERTLAENGPGGDPLAAYLAQAQQRGEIRSDLPVGWMLTTLRGLAVVAMIERQAGRLTAEQAGNYVGETVATAFLAPGGK